MIGVVSEEDQRVIQEFFELFKTPWEFAREGARYDVLLVTCNALPVGASARVIAVYSSEALSLHHQHSITCGPKRQTGIVNSGHEHIPLYGDHVELSRKEKEKAIAIRVTNRSTSLVFVGYDLFTEVRHLLTSGQPVDRSVFPTVELHIALLRSIILREGLVLIEIPPKPAGSAFFACLTHDIDFVSLRQHRFDHTMAGFLYRATAGSVVDLVTRRKTLRDLARNFAGAVKLPLVHLGIANDYWMPFPEYLKIENGRPSTFFLIPFKKHAGAPLGDKDNSRRASCYDVSDINEWASTLQANRCEIGLHGLDAWCSLERARTELDRMETATSRRPTGVRMHWLYFNEKSAEILDAAGFEYDSTSGYNDAVGYRAGTCQVFRPLTSARMLELPMHIQDTALFYPGRMHLKPPQAWELCHKLIANARTYSGVLTILWHDRSLVPERLWGEFYAELLDQLDQANVWWATAETVTRWFQARRTLRFCSSEERAEFVEVTLDGVPDDCSPDIIIRFSQARTDGSIESIDKPLEGRSRFVFPRQSGGSQASRAPVQSESDPVALAV